MMNDMDLDMVASGSFWDNMLQAYRDILYEAAYSGLLGIPGFLAVVGTRKEMVSHDETGAWGGW